jgi:hypothetical protein
VVDGFGQVLGHPEGDGYARLRLCWCGSRHGCPYVTHRARLRPSVRHIASEC